MTALAAVVVLVIGLLAPSVQTTALGETKTYSVLRGIETLYERGQIGLATILLVFSVVFPLSKLLLIVLAVSRLTRLSRRWRSRLHKVSVATGKYSLLDVLVVAVMIVAVQVDGFADVQARPGLWWFAGAIGLSLISGWLVRLESGKTDPGVKGRE